MSLDFWGTIPKSQTDSEQVEGAIQRLIDAHNADPDAHLGAGQSLQSHKASDIIDHQASSIVADKIAYNNNGIYVPTNSGDGMNLDQVSYFFGYNFANLRHGAGQTDDGVATLFDLLGPDYGYANGDAGVDFFADASGTTGSWNIIIDTGFAQIQFKQGFVRFGYYDGTWHYTSYQADSSPFGARYRIRYDAVTHNLQFLRNGIVLLQMTYTIVIEDDEFKFRAIFHKGSSSLCTLNLGNIFYNFQV